MLVISVSHVGFIMLRKFPFIPSLLNYMVKGIEFCSVLFLHQLNCLVYLHSVNIVCITLVGFSCIESSLHYRAKSHLIMYPRGVILLLCCC